VSIDDGNPIVLYDEQADRWLISQYACDFPDEFHQCVAVSTTPDPTGSWYRYDFLVSSTKLNDYAKIGVWPDGYYLAFNQFDGASIAPAGQGVAVLERDAMLSGNPGSRIISFDLFATHPDLIRMLPSDLDGPPPAAGAPNHHAMIEDDSLGSSSDQLQIWAFHADWDNPASSTFTSVTSLATAPFDSDLCNYSRNCIPQPDTAEKLDPLSNRLMYRLQYRNFGAYQTLVANHTVDIDGTDHAGIRWYELRNSGTRWLINQQGTYAGDAPDSNHRWSGSIAMDAAGNMALGYSVSGPDTYPSIRCVGRMATDPPGTLHGGETVLMEGHGSQTNSSHRWGGYSSMSVDPTNDDFWYVQEYYAATSSLEWQTRVSSFDLQGSTCPRRSTQGFEAGVMPPHGWTRVQTNASETWKIMTTGSPHSGLHAADVSSDPGLEPQDEVLLTPELRMTSGILTFYSMGSLHWCRDTNDNCDLQLWLVVGDWDAGAGDDICLGKADNDWTASWAWSLSSLDLTPVLPGKPFRIGFRYLGLDGAQVGLDDIQICYQGAGDMPWLLLLLGD